MSMTFDELRPPTDREFRLFQRLVYEHAGIHLAPVKRALLSGRLSRRIRELGLKTFGAYYDFVRERGEAERTELIDRITTNETSFFREPRHFEFLSRQLLAARQRTPGFRPLRIWSAGCSSGEEPYTLALLAAERLDRCGRGEALDRVRIDATDVDRVCLERARAATYRREALAELPPELVADYFEPAGTDLRLLDRLRQRVTLAELDLGRQRPPRRDYHLILCRNVVIYFDRPMQERLFQVFADSLAPGGYLVLGKVETLFGPARDRLQLVEPRERIYRRPA